MNQQYCKSDLLAIIMQEVDWLNTPAIIFVADVNDTVLVNTQNVHKITRNSCISDAPWPDDNQDEREYHEKV